MAQNLNKYLVFCNTQMKERQKPSNSLQGVLLSAICGSRMRNVFIVVINQHWSPSTCCLANWESVLVVGTESILAHVWALVIICFNPSGWFFSGLGYFPFMLISTVLKTHKGPSAAHPTVSLHYSLLCTLPWELQLCRLSPHSHLYLLRETTSHSSGFSFPYHVLKTLQPIS